MTPTNDSNPWWSVFKQAVTAAGGKIAKPEILASTTDARYMRQLGIPTLGFSPMSNTPILLHDHDEVCLIANLSLRCPFHLVLIVFPTLFYLAASERYCVLERN